MSFYFYFYFNGQKSIQFYLDNQFQKDLESLDVRPIDDEVTLEEFPELTGQSYFGRPEWGNYRRDISGINKKLNKKICEDETFYYCSFVEGLFIHTLINRVLELYYPDQFKQYRYNFIPRFGWFNFGYSDERLPYLLDVPQKDGVPFSRPKQIKEIISGLIYIVNSEVVKLGITYDDFMEKLCEDFEVKNDKFLKYKSYKMEEESAFLKFTMSLRRKFKRELEKKKSEN